MLKEKKHDFVRSLGEHLLTYALGRPLDYYDIETIRQIVASAEKNDYKFSSLIVEIVKSYPFRYLHAEPESH